MATADLQLERRSEDQEDTVKPLKARAFLGPPPALLLLDDTQIEAPLTNKAAGQPLNVQRASSSCGGQKHKLTNRKKSDQMATSHREHEDELQQDCKENVEMLNRQDNIMSSYPAQQKRNLETETHQRHEDKQRADQTERGSQLNEQTGSERQGREGQKNKETSIMASADLQQEQMLEDQEDTETSIMVSADLQLEQMFSWMEQRELCAEQLRKLAKELESFREKHSVCKRLGCAAAVFGALCLIWAGVASYFISVAAAAVAVFGVTILVVTNIIKRFLSSKTMKELQKMAENYKSADEIQKPFQQLKAELKNRSPSADPDEVDQHTMTEILRAVGRRSGLKGEINVRIRDNKPQFYLGVGLRHRVFNQIFYVPEVVVGLAGILTFFTFELSGTEFQLLFAEGAEQLKQVATAGLQTALRRGAKAVGGALGLAFSLPEAIKNWTEMIKKNHVTEASQSLRDTADDLLKISQTLRDQFDSIRKMLDQMATSQREHEDELQQEMIDKDNIICSNLAANIQARSEQPGCCVNGNDEREGMTDPDYEMSEEETSSSDYTDYIYRYNPNRHDIMIRTRQNFMNTQIPGAIKVGLLNVRSLRARTPNGIQKTGAVLNLIRQYHLEVFLITETWLRDDAVHYLTLASPPDFSFCYQVRELGLQGGGVAIQLAWYLYVRQIHFNITTFEYVATELQHNEWTEPVLIINVYQPHGQRLHDEPFRAFLFELRMLFDHVSTNYNSIIVTGDFNIHVDANNYRAGLFLGLLQHFNLVQHVRWPTHQANHTLDLVITRNVEIPILFVWDDEISDHYTVYFAARPYQRAQRSQQNKYLNV